MWVQMETEHQLQLLPELLLLLTTRTCPACRESGLQGDQRRGDDSEPLLSSHIFLVRVIIQKVHIETFKQVPEVGENNSFHCLNG